MICLFNCLYVKFEALRDDLRLWVEHALNTSSTQQDIAPVHTNHQSKLINQLK